MTSNPAARFVVSISLRSRERATGKAQEERSDVRSRLVKESGDTNSRHETDTANGIRSCESLTIASLKKTNGCSIFHDRKLATHGERTIPAKKKSTVRWYNSINEFLFCCRVYVFSKIHPIRLFRHIRRTMNINVQLFHGEFARCDNVVRQSRQHAVDFPKKKEEKNISEAISCAVDRLETFSSTR